jgi:hypothetical protein
MNRGEALPQVAEIFLLRLVGPADGDDGKAALLEARGECAPAVARPLLVAKHWCCMDHGDVVAGRDRIRRAGRRTDQLRHPRDAKRVGEAHHLLDAMDVRRQRRAAMKDAAFEETAKPRPIRVGQPGVRTPGEQREHRRAVAGLGRNREVVALEQARRECSRLRERRPRRRGDDVVDIGIALDDAGGARKHQRVDRSVGKGAPQAADQRRRQ